MENNTIELIARAVVVCDGNILLCRSKGKDNYFLPGGHVEFNEDSITALKREIKEEIDGAVIDTRFIGILENKFFQDGEEKHEMNIVFEVHLASSEIHVLEDHIECVWVPLAEFKEGRVLPVSLKEKILQWMQDKQVFFGSEKGDKRVV